MSIGQEFQKGDLVILKSGGPVMTVQSVSDYSMSAGPEHGVECVWFDKTKRFVEVFDAATLERS
jgi:uncharacterized protein YodC (DUF2158 family)